MPSIDKGGSVSTVLEGTPTIAVATYSANDFLGTAELVLSPAAIKRELPRIVVGSGTIVNVIVTDKAAQTATMDVVFWDTEPSNTTFADETPLTMADADLANVIGVVTVDTWTSFVNNSVGMPAAAVAIPYVLKEDTTIANTTLYAGLITRGTPAYASTSDLTLRVMLYLD